MIRERLEKFGLQRLESLVLALVVALPVGFLALGESPAFADDDDDGGKNAYELQRTASAPGKPAAPADAAVAAWQNECGSCHVPFPAKRLPAASWQKIMGNLGDHYGTDASIDDAALTKQISTFLVKNAGDPARYQDSKGAAVPMRITETRWFVREHDEVGAGVWKRPSIKSASNCGACHQGAADGNFSERGIRIPKQ